MAKKQRLEEMQGLKDRTNAEIEELEQKIERINADLPPEHSKNLHLLSLH